MNSAIISLENSFSRIEVSLKDIGFPKRVTSRDIECILCCVLGVCSGKKRQETAIDSGSGISFLPRPVEFDEIL